MAEVNTGGGDDHGGKKRAKKQSTRIDMTPMVDLAFLLLTFFVLTATFSKPKTLEINFPADDPVDKPQKVNNALTFLLTKENKLFYYYGEFYSAGNDKGAPATTLIKTDFSKDGIRKLLLEYNKFAVEEIKKLEQQLIKKEIADTTFKRLAVDAKGDKKALMALVKADEKATYKNVIDIVDEFNICNVGKYAIVDMGKDELDLLLATDK
ncbi:MAG: biopolymer transporter ExbD [Chitinophagaceae bacterium]|nr:biopolymer transporter ExbD [Chitinophagaceae bacterium]